MATQPLSIDQFAAKVKAKYPDYALMDNGDLVNRIVAKYPEYKSQIDFSNGSAPNAGLAGVAQPKVDMQPLGDEDMMGNGMPSEEDLSPKDTPFVTQATTNLKNAAKSTGHIIKVGGGTLAKIAANPNPAGVAQALGDEAVEQQANGGIPKSKDIVMQPLKELAGERQPGESATLGFTGHDPSQQPLPTRTANAMSSLMGGDPASARAHFTQAATFYEQGNRDAASAENQRGTADLTAVPIATVGLGRLLGASPKGVPRDLPEATPQIARPSFLSSMTADALNKSAQADLGKVLAPTKQATKFIAKEKVIPGMQERGIVSRSSSALQDRAQANIQDLGQKIDDAYDAMPRQPSVPTQPIIADLENYKNQFVNPIPDGQGGIKNIVLDQSALDRINDMQDLVRQHGEAIDPQSLRQLRQYLDTQVSRAKGYQGKTLAEGQNADVQKIAANSIRSQLAQSVPGLADLNSEFSFWKNLNDVLEETAQRRTGQQGGGLGRKIAAGTGTVVGAKIGGPAGALIGNKVGDLLSRVTNSTGWNTLKAATKTKLASALASRDPQALNAALADAQRVQKAPTFIRGQLQAAPTITPPPADTSGSVPFNAPPAVTTSRAQRMGLLLPESTDPIPLPASTAPTSQEGLLTPGKIIARDPKSGQAKTFFTTGSQEQAGPTQYQMGRPSFLRNADQRQPANAALRKRVADMSPEERAQALLTSEKTGLPNYRAFQESSHEDGQHVGYADMDNFKSYNDALGHDGVDRAVLPAIGDIFKAAGEKHGVSVFHRSGDEFLFRSGDPSAISNAVNDVNQKLANTTFEFKTPDGRILAKKGTGLSHGIGQDENSAELSAQQDKQSRAAQGLRSEREAVQGLDTGRSAGQPVAASDNPGRQGVPGSAPNANNEGTVRPAFLRKKGGK